MARTLPPLNALRAFEAAGRHESFSRAADELGVSHSAISKHVRGLEDRLGAHLFRDMPRGVALTPEGQRYLAEVTPAFDAIGEATEVFAERAKGTVVVNCENVFAVKTLVPRLRRFFEKFPDVDVELEASRHIADLTRYEADIAVRFRVHDDPEPGEVLLSNAPIYPFANPEVAQEIDADPARLLDYRLLRDRLGDPWAAWFTAIGRPELCENLRPTPRMRALLAQEATASGLGVLLASSDNTEGDVTAGRLVQLFDTGISQGSYHLVFGQGVLRRKPVRVFRDWLLAETARFRT